MDKKLNLNEKAILDKQFKKDIKGYDDEEVDSFLDLVIEDYALFGEYQRESSQYIRTLEEKINSLNSQKRDLEIENSRYAHKFKGIKEGANVTSENIELLQRINALENFLYSRGFDPKDIK